MKFRLTAIAFLLGLFSCPASAQTLTLPPDFFQISQVPTPAASTSSQSVEWQRQFEQAQGNKRAGKNKMLLGAGAFGGGLVVVLASAGDNGGSGASSGGIVLGNIVMLGGAGATVWGFVQWNQASGKLSQLELQKAQGKVVSLLRLNQHQSIDVAMNRMPSIQYRLVW